LNGYAVDTGNLAPEGWHVPTHSEWTILTNYIAPDGIESWGNSIAGGKMKECTPGSCPESEYWNSPNTGETNESGFTGLPGGYRHDTGGYVDLSYNGSFWTSTESSPCCNRRWRLDDDYSGIDHVNEMKLFGLSVRCVRDPVPETIFIPQDYPTIQAGIDATSDGDTVLVSAGTYVENVNFNGKNIALIGVDRETTIIDGNQSGSVVTFNSGEDSTAVLTGFTITNGNHYNGGGIYCDSTSPSIRDCIISANVGVEGGGIFPAVKRHHTSTLISINNSRLSIYTY
jgi:uncharacterized protein (TIGR02145 family)